MGMQTGENEQAMRKILDMTRLISIVILVIQFYYYCYEAWVQWNFTACRVSVLLFQPPARFIVFMSQM
jgi:hypothetical protein